MLNLCLVKLLISFCLCDSHISAAIGSEIEQIQTFVGSPSSGITTGGASSGIANNFVDDQQCLANYELNEGIIIRTKDSLANGAKYLNESDLGTNVKSKEECLRICCQTPHCNVITYEEKVVKHNC